ncbi:unnamed protein product [Microthlaspi erraticum]|uniref:Uncharacterized protein n=1 Tax=Microthlaspi erraticum TaxID=1685480 RepID=A0A6D2KD20_9BRAS|nr:unnamed protein product [Microthlaspi erraticum]
MFRARPKRIVRLMSRPKSKATRPITQHDPGNIVPRSAKFQRFTPLRARPTRASRGTSLAAAQLTSRTTADASVRAGKNVPRPAGNHRPNLHPPDHAGTTVKSSGRPSRTTVRTPRSTRSRF